MERILVMEAEQKKLKQDLEFALANAVEEGRKPSYDERRDAERIVAKLEALDAKMKLERAGIEFDRTEAVPIATAAPASAADGNWTAPTRSEGEKLSYRSLFGQPKADAHFGRGEDFFSAIASGRYHPGLIQASMLEGLGSSGGFLVPSELSAEMFDAAIESAVFLPRCKTFAMISDERQVAGFVADGSTSYGGYGWGASWVAEAAAISESDPTVRKVSIVARKIALLVGVSSELLADGLKFGEQLGDAMKKALTFAVDEAILRGNGAGKPLGVLAAPATVTVSKEAGQAAGSLVANNVLKAYARMLPSSHARATWFIHPSVLPSLYALSLPVGVGGQLLAEVPAYFNASSMSLLGRPVVITEKCSALGTLGDVVFADFGMYGLGLRKEIELQQSNAPGFANDLMHFRAIARVGGLPLLSEAYQPKQGSDKLSPFVVIEARA